METEVRIKLNSGTSSILKAGFLFRALFFGGFVFGAAALGISMFHDSLLLAVLCFVVSFVLIIVIYRMLGAAFQSEEVVVTEQNLTIYQKGIHLNTQETIALDAIKQIGFAETQYTPNPMDNAIIDFTGLGAQERELQYVIDEGNIVLETDTQTFRFGKKLPSWEVEDFISQVEEITGRKFERLPQKDTTSLNTIIETEEEGDEEKNR